MSWSVEAAAPGDPAAYASLAHRFDSVAADAADIRAELENIARGVDSSIWRGRSADAFADEIGKLPRQLQQLHDSYDTAAQAMKPSARLRVW